jgi:hypothetical protein
VYAERTQTRLNLKDLKLLRGGMTAPQRIQKMVVRKSHVVVL